MSQNPEQNQNALATLGWSPFFGEQVLPDEAALIPMRVATVHRSRLTAVSVAGPQKPKLPHQSGTADFAVGDWVLVDPKTRILTRRLDRSALFQRRPEGANKLQLIAANVDTLFIVTSCNADFNPARLERYLALANEAGTDPVILLTKADQVDDAQTYRDQAAALQRDLPVVAVNAKDPAAATALRQWCGAGRTVAFVGSSGVGKSTLLNTLTNDEDAQETGSIRESDAKGRHTTTTRSLHRIDGGGCVIDTPGMRSLHVSDVASGLDQLFAEISERAPECQFNDCTHSHEPGCAVLNAVATGAIDPARLERWHKLQDENRQNTPVETGARGKKTVKKARKRR